MVEALRIQPRTRISHCDQHALRFSFPGPNQQLSWTLAGSTHGFDGVHDQIENHLLQMDSVCQNERHVIRELSLQRDTRFRCTSLRASAMTSVSSR